MKLNIFIFFLMSLSCLFAQSKTNFDIIDSLIYLSTEQISEELNLNEEYFLEFIGADDYDILKSKVIQFLKYRDIGIVESEKKQNKLTYNLEAIKINYTDVFKDGLFGTYLVRRDAYLSGSFFLTKNGEINDVNSFNNSLADTVLYSEVSQLDNIAYPFTSAELPDEPFFSSTLEPVIAIGTAAVAVYLFFNIRSR
jgi:hypothetical protein